MTVNESVIKVCFSIKTTFFSSLSLSPTGCSLIVIVHLNTEIKVPSLLRTQSRQMFSL